MDVVQKIHYFSDFSNILKITSIRLSSPQVNNAITSCFLRVTAVSEGSNGTM